MEYDNTNTAIAFIEDGLFQKEGVEALKNKPVISIKANIDGVEKEISLWFSKNKDGSYKLTKNNKKMLTGVVKAPYKKEDTFQESTTTPPPDFTPETTSNDIPF